MIYQKSLFLWLVLAVLTITGCNTTNRKEQESESKTADSTAVTTEKEVTMTPSQHPGIFFKASGNEPFWNITMDNQQIVFTSLIEGLESLSVPLPEVRRTADANVKLYRAETEKTALSLTISQESCADTMADMESPYAVTLDINLNSGEKPLALKGCGTYQTDPRLNDIWVLEQVGEEKADPAWFESQLPEMEINTTENTFMGFAGCNRMRGGIFWEPGVFRFVDIATTRMACHPDNRESDFLENLKRVTSYRIENNRLWLSNPNGLLLVFKKVD